MWLCFLYSTCIDDDSRGCNGERILSIDAFISKFDRLFGCVIGLHTVAAGFAGIDDFGASGSLEVGELRLP